jgi:hypothetical protein
MSNIDLEVEAILGQFRPILHAALTEAQTRGGADMRAAILRAAGLEAPQLKPLELRALEAPAPRRKPATRSPRGLLAQGLAEALQLQPGASTRAVEDYVTAWDQRIARKSVGNELRRQEDRLYRRDGDGGWYLMEARMT